MNIIPELNLWIYQRYFEGPINEISYDFPTEVDSSKWGTSDSIINLLFNDTFNSTSYKYFYRPIDFTYMNDTILMNRLSAHRSEVNIYDCISSTRNIWKLGLSEENIFNVTSEEIELLDILLDYRINGTDSSSEIDIIVYDELESSFSKLIYVYLELMINSNVSIYSTDTLLADSDRFIELIYEKYVIDTYFRIIKNNYLILDSTATLKIIELESQIDKFELSYYHIITKKIALSHTPKELDDVNVIINGIMKKIIFDYNIIIENDIPYLIWEGLTLEDELITGSKIYVTYSYEN